MGFQLSFAVWLAGEPEEDALEWCKIRHGDLYYRSETQPLTRLRKLIHPRGSVPRVSELGQNALIVINACSQPGLAPTWNLQRILS